MAEAAGRERWGHTATLCALIANVNRDPKKGRPLKPADFDPYAAKDKRESIETDLTGLKEAFTKGCVT